MKLSIGLLVVSFLLILIGVADRQDDWFALALVPAAASVLTYVLALKSRLALAKTSGTLGRRLAQIEERLTSTELELDAATREIEILRAERDFDRELLGAGFDRRGVTSG